MRLQELFLVETTDEDRAIVSLATTIASYINNKYSNEDAEERSYDNDDVDSDELDIHGDEDETIDVGAIGKLFDTPLTVMNPIKLQLQSDYGIRLRIKREHGSEVIKKPGEQDIMGLWYPSTKIMILNKDYLGSNNLRSVVAHELRHALDDFKSDFKANASKRYSTPKNKSYRKVTNDPHQGNLAYLAEPAEINARFVQVLHDLVPPIARAARLEPEAGNKLVFNKLNDLMAEHRIADLFPEGTESKDFKRLVKRAVDFIEKEIKHIKSKQQQ